MALWVRMVLITATPDQARHAIDGHLVQLRELGRQGKVRAAGRLGRDDGFVEILEAADRHEAEAIARASPLVELGLASWTLREWTEIDLEGA